MNKKPKIRFKGFTNDWEQRKFGDCFTERIESMPEGELISVTINDGVKKFSELGRYDNSNENKSKYKKVCIGDIAYNSMRMWQGASGYSPYEGIVSPAYTVLAAKAGIDSKCMSYQIKLPNILHIFQINSQGITSDNWILKFPVLKEIKIIVANEPIEQQKIAQFFQNLDKLITLHQRKCEKLKNIKKSLLEKMFPKNNEKNPAIRFKGFTNDWEQRKFGDLYGQVTEKNDLTYGVDKNITVASMQYKKDVYITNDDYLRTYTVCLLGDIVFEGHQSKQFRFGRFVENDLGNGIVSHIFMVFRPRTDYDLRFWKYAINNEQLMREILSHCTKASRMMNDLVISDFFKESIPVPSISEQRMIGKIFTNFDKLITLHQRKLEKLQNIKKALLEKMFV